MTTFRTEYLVTYAGEPDLADVFDTPEEVRDWVVDELGNATYEGVTVSSRVFRTDVTPWEETSNP